MPFMHFLASDAATNYLLLWFGVSGLSLLHMRANLNLGGLLLQVGLRQEEEISGEKFSISCTSNHYKYIS